MGDRAACAHLQAQWHVLHACQCRDHNPTLNRSEHSTPSLAASALRLRGNVTRGAIGTKDERNIQMSVTNTQLEKLARVVRGVHSADLSNDQNHTFRRNLGIEIATALDLDGMKRQRFTRACADPMIRIAGR